MNDEKSSYLTICPELDGEPDAVKTGRRISAFAGVRDDVTVRFKCAAKRYRSVTRQRCRGGVGIYLDAGVI